MENSNATITVEVKGLEVDVDVTGYVTEGGSNSHGSDDPEWIRIEDVAYTHPATGKPLSPRLTALINKEYGDYVEERLTEDYE